MKDIFGKTFFTAVFLMLSLCGCSAEPEYSDIVLDAAAHETALEEFWGEFYYAAPSSAEEFSYKYNESTGGIRITDYLGNSAEVRIPDTIDDIPVTAVDLSLCYKNIKSLIVPDTVQLVKLAGYDDIDSYIKGTDAERYTRLSYYYAAELGGVVVNGYTGMGGRVRIPPQLPDPKDLSRSKKYDVKKVALYEYDKDITQLIIPDSVKHVFVRPYEDVLIYESEINEQLADTVKTGIIYENIGVEKMNIPAAMMKDKPLSFAQSTLKSVYIPDNFTYIADGMFQESPLLNEVVFGSDSFSIGSNAFYECTSLIGIDLTGAVSVGAASFSGCKGLAEITLPQCLTEIGAGAFARCTGIREITIPAAVENIGTHSFSGCTRLDNVSVDSRNTHFYAENGIIYSRDTASPVGFEPQADIR